MEKTAIVFTGGRAPQKERITGILKKAGIVVAADSGWDTAMNMGINPDVFIGDMDSTVYSGEIMKLPEDRRYLYPQDKDFSDTELAIRFVYKKGYRDIVLIGGGEGRIDHLLSIMQIFRTPERPTQWFTAHEQIVCLEGEAVFETGLNRTVSVFPVERDDITIESSGLKWPLGGVLWRNGDISLSNRTTEEKIRIIVEKGPALVIINNG